jgi:hypothetical protein
MAAEGNQKFVKERELIDFEMGGNKERFDKLRLINKNAR